MSESGETHARATAIPLAPTWVHQTRSDTAQHESLQISALTFGGDDALPLLAYGTTCGHVGIIRLESREHTVVHASRFRIGAIADIGNRRFACRDGASGICVVAPTTGAPGGWSVWLQSIWADHDIAIVPEFLLASVRTALRAPMVAVADGFGFRCFDLRSDASQEIPGRFGRSFGGMTWREVTALAIRPDGGRIASGDAHGCVRFWDPRIRGWFRSRRVRPGTPSPLVPQMSFRSRVVRMLAWTSDGTSLFVGSGGGLLQFLDAEDGAPVAPSRDIGTPHSRTLTVSQNGRWVTGVVNDYNIGIYDFGAPDFGIPPPWDRPFV